MTAMAAPGPKGYPVLGVTPMMIKRGADFLLEAFHTYGDVVALPLKRPTTMYLLAHPDHVQKVLVKNNAKYIVVRPSAHYNTLMGNGLTVSNGDYWRRQRRILQPAFQRRKADVMGEIITARIAAVIDGWDRRPDSKVEISHQMERISLGVLLDTLLGTSLDDRQVVRLTSSVQRVLTAAGRGMFLEIPPSWPTPENRRIKHAQQEINQVIQEIIRQRRASGPRAEQDLLSLLLEARDEASGEVLRETELRDEITANLVAGYETTACALDWCLNLVATHPDVEERLVTEIQTALGNRRPTVSDVTAMSYLSQVINESMRLIPPFWAYTRVLLGEEETFNGHRIPPNSLIVISPWVTHHHPDFWPDPERFDPGRFTPQQTASRHRFAYFPFGAGPRVCVGMGPAQLTLQLAITMILQQYQLRLVPGHTPQPRTAMTVHPKDGIFMHTRPRATPV
ncbi:cytochrome P450 [Kribbella sp. CA-294648]|uniref:cytochrome P450 n=1 Tax=Kribbella sp. CA-294648 TaxID=3239948 RepID=UPI003D92482F